MLKACPTCGRIQCETHANPKRTRIATADRPARRGSTRAYRTARQRVLERDGHRCHYCAEMAGQVDHITPVITGGTDDETNLVACCAECNLAKADSPIRPVPTVAVLGELGSGKSTFAEALAEHTAWPTYSIDSYRARGLNWPGLIDALSRSQGPAIIESVAMPRDYRRLLVIRNALLVYVDCPEHERQRRLTERRRDLPRDMRFVRAGHLTVDGTARHDEMTLAPVFAAAVLRGTA